MGDQTAGTAKANDQSTQELIESAMKLEPKLAKPSIYRVPKELRSGNAKLFEPISIPIGPLHYNKLDTPALEFKKWYLKNFLGRLGTNSVDNIMEKLRELETECHEFYSDINSEIKGDKFVQIMLLDGCFIMELLLSYENSYDTLVGNTEKVPILTLQQDLLKIENQLPLLVLDCLAQMAWECQKSEGETNPDESNNLDVIDLALKFFNISKTEKSPEKSPNDPPRHLLELIMNARFQENEEDPKDQAINVDGDSSSSSSILREARSASELEYYGIKFEQGHSENLTKLEFKKGHLIIPSLKIRESTEMEFWNFLIFEMLSCTSRIFTSYVVLMDTLINSEKDVEILQAAKILVLKKNDTKSLVSLFNDMPANVGQQNFYFKKLMRTLDTYCRSSYHPTRAYLMRHYYDVRWSVLSNILLFFLTVTQTLFALFALPGMQKRQVNLKYYLSYKVLDLLL